MAHPPENLLLVEGDEDKRVIPQLVEANGHTWGERSRSQRVLVDIVPSDGIDKLLEHGYIKTTLQQSGLKRCGILVDANSNPVSRWEAVRGQLALAALNVPKDLPVDGAFCETTHGVRVGVWIMPDNLRAGMLETFLQRLRQDGHATLLAHAEDVCRRAKSEKGAEFRDVHFDKAVIHAWLAWQDPPGRQLHNAVMERILDPKSPNVAPFLAWFRKLYDLPVPALTTSQS